MSESNQAVLQRAYELIERDELEQAQEILAPLLETDAGNPSLWWVYTHAMRDTALGRAALDRVLELDPAYPGASELKADLQQIQAQEEEFVALEQGGNGSAPAATSFDIDDWEDLQPAVETQAGSSLFGRGAILAILVLGIVVLGLGLVVSGAVELPAWLTELFPTPEPAVIVVSAPTDESVSAAAEAEATSPLEGAAVEATAPAPNEDEAPEATAEFATVTLAVEATVAAGTAEATSAADAAATAEPGASATAEIASSPTREVAGPVVSAFINLVADKISKFEIDPTAGAMWSTGLGNTLVIDRVCAVPGDEFSARLISVMNAVADTTEYIPEAVDAVGVGLINCDDAQARARVIGVSVGSILQYAGDDIDEKDFQRAWQPLS